MGQAARARRPVFGDRPPAYVSREQGAAELCLSADTWDAMVRNGQIPQPVKTGISGTTPRWRWADVDAALSGRAETSMMAPEPFFREPSNGATKDRRRAAS
jgi:predicted DNA-binding transcriptional regulator AlpA